MSLIAILDHLVYVLGSDWFFGVLEGGSKEAEKRLAGRAVGTYLVRCNNRRVHPLPLEAPFIISRVLPDGTVRHKYIQRAPNGGLFAQFDVVVPSLQPTPPIMIEVDTYTITRFVVELRNHAIAINCIDRCPGYPFVGLFETDPNFSGTYKPIEDEV